jgi:hypothetical protein
VNSCQRSVLNGKQTNNVIPIIPGKCEVRRLRDPLKLDDPIGHSTKEKFKEQEISYDQTHMTHVNPRFVKDMQAEKTLSSWRTAGKK